MDNKEIIELMKSRFACKQFSDKKISEQDLNTILEVGRLSPTSTGGEPYIMLVLNNQDIKDRICEVSWGGKNQIKQASNTVVFLAKNHTFTKYNSPLLKNHFLNVSKQPQDIVEKRIEIYENFQMNEFSLDTNERLLAWAHRQIYIVLGNMLTLSKAMGIDSCPIEGFNKHKVNEILRDVPPLNSGEISMDNLDVSVIATFGYASQPPKYPKTRRDIDDAVKYY